MGSEGLHFPKLAKCIKHGGDRASLNNSNLITQGEIRQGSANEKGVNQHIGDLNNSNDKITQYTTNGNNFVEAKFPEHGIQNKPFEPVRFASPEWAIWGDLKKILKVIIL